MRRFIYSLSMLAGLVLPALGQQDDDAARGVARVSVIAGDVSVRRGDSGDQVAATVNAPLMAQDSLMTGVGARAEMQFDAANLVRLSGNTEVRIAELQSQRVQLNIAGGLVTFRMLQNSQSEVDLNTPSVSVRPLRQGQYRIQVNEDGTTEVTVREGEVDLYTPQGSRRLGQGKTLIVRAAAEGTDGTFQIVNAQSIDGWDQWNRSRDQELLTSRSQQYLPQGAYGAEQLDNSGDWTYSEPYGYVWQPRVDADWAPYRDGRWSWLDWYGWSWVSYDPWGWAPYHYGRWFNNGGRWCWWPGARGSRSYWSPALVSFFGFGSGRGGGFGIGFNFGNVGWVPLAPYETYNRWWGRGYYGGRGFGNTTIINNTNITNIYRNARVKGGASFVDANNFNRGVSHLGGKGYQAANLHDIRNAGEVRGQLGIVPGRESLGFSRQDGVRGGGSIANRPDQRFQSRREVSSVERVPFEQQRQNFVGASRGNGQTGMVDRGGNASSPNEGFRRLGGDSNAATRGGQQGSDGFVQRGGRGAESGAGRGGGQTSEGFVQRGERGAEAGTRGGGQTSDGFVQRGNSSGSGNDNVRGGWQRFGDAGVNSGVRGGGQNNNGFVQRDRSASAPVSGSDPSSMRGRGVGAVDVSPRIVQNGGRAWGSESQNIGQQPRQNQGSSDPYGGGSRGNANSNSGWSGFGGVRGGGSSGPAVQQSAPRTSPSYGGGGGGYSPSPRMSAPSAPSYGGGGSAPRMSAPSAPSGGGGFRGGGGAPSGGGGGGHSGGGGGSSAGRSGGGGGHSGGRR
ncbi:DUF6600 domain-containing protein [Bryobacter aggregatus]|uniref:DUF6600 domain-containing protein n=1 Tax=Bryobacter aggregatus TaxID=360054 RepID=UPI0004E26B87|nr:DUF6600 domain-containing protein [Bryobacter aggregatus]